jgi:hypothetical protein
LWHRDVQYVAREANAFDAFGSTLASGDLDGDGYHDLAVGVPNETLEVGAEDVYHCGTIHVFFGSLTGLSAARDKPLSPFNSVTTATSEPFDRFGDRLVVTASKET